MRARLLLAATLALAAGTVAADPLTYALPDPTTTFRPGPNPGFEAAQNNCQSCHSVDYVQTQPPGKGKAFWDAEVTKMIKVYGAPIEAADAKAIGDYLAGAY